MKPLFVLTVSLAIVGMFLLAAGCVSPGGNQTPTPAPTTAASTPSVTATVSETATPTSGAVPGTGTPRVTIVSPHSYSAVTTTDVTVEVVAENFTPGRGPAFEDVGNIVYYMDLEPLTAPDVQANMTLPGEEGTFAVSTNTSHTFTNVKPGTHTFSVELVHPDNTPFDPPAVDIVEMVAVGPDATPPTPVPGVLHTAGPVTALPTVQPSNTTAAATVTTAAATTTAAANATTAATTTAAANATTAATTTAAANATTAATTTAAANATTAATTAAGGGTATVSLSAQDIAFDTSTITVPAGADVTVNFDNKDNGIPHNFAVYTDSSASQSIFVGDTITGPDTTTYTFTAPSDPGTYYFRCDVHPQQMNGDFVVQ